MIDIGRMYIDGHPHIIITFDNENCLVVNITEYNKERTFRFDDTCILEKGDHEYIKKKSIVSYRDTKFQKINELEKDFSKKNLKYSSDILNTQIMAKIKAGFKKGIKEEIFSKEIIIFMNKNMPELFKKS